jgi:hypothetical protein
LTNSELNSIAHILHECFCGQIIPVSEASAIAKQFTDTLIRTCTMPVGFDAEQFKRIICHNDGASLDPVPMDAYSVATYLALFASVRADYTHDQ